VRGDAMITMDELVAVIGQSIDAPPPRALLDTLERHTRVEEDILNEGIEPIQWLSFPEDGFLIRLNSQGRIEAIHIFVVAEEGFRPYAGDLIVGLSSRDGRPAVRQKLGSPTRSGEQFTHDILGPQGAWDRYDSESVSIHFQYVFDGDGLRLVTIMAADLAP
jgi:hypothetical protein